MKKILLVSVILTLIPLFAGAAAFRFGVETPRYESEHLLGNLYTASRDIFIDQPVVGDVVAAGATVRITGTVSDDVIAAGGTLYIDGDIGEDARLAGGEISISESIGGDLVAAAGKVTILDTATIHGDVAVTGGEIAISGALTGDVRISGRTVFIDGIIGGELSIQADTITFGEHAIVSGDFRYVSPELATIHTAATIIGETTYTPTKFRHENIPYIFYAFSLTKVLMLLVAGLILHYAFRRPTARVVHHTTGSHSVFWKEVLRGFIILVVFPVMIVLSFLTVVGAPLGILALLVYVFLVVLASIYAGLIFGSLLIKLVQRKAEITVSWLTVAVGIILLALVRIIPILGWIIVFIFFLAALGGVFGLLHKKLREHGASH